MSTTRRLIEGRYLQDILDRPRAVDDTVRGLFLSDKLRLLRAELASGELRRIVLTGMRSSFHALLPSYLALSTRGYEVVLAETSELLNYLPRLLTDESLLVVVSQSGRSAEILKLLEAKAAGSKTIAVTNSGDNLLAKSCDVLLLTLAGDEFSVSSKSYVTSLVALEILSSFLCTGDSAPVITKFEHLGAIVQSYLNGWREYVEELSDFLERKLVETFRRTGAKIAHTLTAATRGSFNREGNAKRPGHTSLATRAQTKSP